MLNRMNGWQRLWLVITVVSLFIFGIATPWFLAMQYRPAEGEFRYALMRDLENPQCAAYATAPMSQLSEPQYSEKGGSCWHIFTHRKVNSHVIVPVTNSSYDDDTQAYNYSQFRLGVAMFGGLVLIISGLVYLMGWLIAWIRRGFKKPA